MCINQVLAWPLPLPNCFVLGVGGREIKRGICESKSFIRKRNYGSTIFAVKLKKLSMLWFLAVHRKVFLQNSKNYATGKRMNSQCTDV